MKVKSNGVEAEVLHYCGNISLDVSCDIPAEVHSLRLSPAEALLLAAALQKAAMAELEL